LGKAYLAFTVDQKLKDDRYQGIVELTGSTWLKRCNIIPSVRTIADRIMVAVDQDTHGRWRGGCLMLQQMPREGGARSRVIHQLKMIGTVL